MPNMIFVNNLLKKTGLKFIGNEAFLFFNNEKVIAFRISNLGYKREEEMDGFQKEFIQENALPENLIFEIFLHGALSKYQYLAYLRIKGIIDKIRLTKGEFVYIIRKALEGESTCAIDGKQTGLEVTYKDDTGKKHDLFTCHFRDFDGRRDYFEDKEIHEWIGEENQKKFLGLLELNEGLSSNEICLLGMTRKKEGTEEPEIGKNRYVGYLRTKGRIPHWLPKREDRTPIVRGKKLIITRIHDELFKEGHKSHKAELKIESSFTISEKGVTIFLKEEAVFDCFNLVKIEDENGKRAWAEFTWPKDIKHKERTVIGKTGWHSPYPVEEAIGAFDKLF
ncbi:hypothetical protein KJ845_01350 [Patescibacteria group bacterium]|nr:hypothetical protein [Patescibacteria group bacterium]